MNRWECWFHVPDGVMYTQAEGAGVSVWVNHGGIRYQRNPFGKWVVSLAAAARMEHIGPFIPAGLPQEVSEAA